MANIKTSVTLPDEIVEQLNKLAKGRRLSRSDLLTLALEEFLDTPENRQALQNILVAEANGQIERSYPNYESQVRRLVEKHLQLEHEPLLLAIYYAPERNPGDVFLFEVIANFGLEMVDPDKKFTEVTFSSSQRFRMKLRQRLHLLLTSPTELRQALEEHWKQAMEVRQALQSQQAIVIWEDPEQGHSLLETLRG